MHLRLLSLSTAQTVTQIRCLSHCVFGNTPTTTEASKLGHCLRSVKMFEAEKACFYSTAERSRTGAYVKVSPSNNFKTYIPSAPVQLPACTKCTLMSGFWRQKAFIHVHTVHAHRHVCCSLHIASTSIRMHYTCHAAQIMHAFSSCMA